MATDTPRFSGARLRFKFPDESEQCKAIMQEFLEHTRSCEDCRNSSEKEYFRSAHKLCPIGTGYREKYIQQEYKDYTGKDLKDE